MPEAGHPAGPAAASVPESLGLRLRYALAALLFFLGYRVLGCESMRYKSAFEPHELLLERPAEDETPRWAPARSRRG